jgi:WD40 repeat protein
VPATLTLTPPPGATPSAGPRATLPIEPTPRQSTSKQSSARRPDLPGYEILAELGRGGMGVVYQARQLRANRLVALKMILSGEYAGATDRERFRVEVEAVARLSHPGIVQVFDVGEHDGLSYFSLEFCPGGALAAKLSSQPLPAREAARIAEHLARAMAAAHAVGVVHRDLKPGNVLLAADGTPKIADFGLAKQLDSVHDQTMSGAILGTPSYMAPEQAAGRAKAVGPAADVWALGAILYEMLTGRPPFVGESPIETLRRVVDVEPIRPSHMQPRTPRDLEIICLKCLRKEPGERYAGALALAEDLRRFQAGEPIEARPVGQLERVQKWVWRNPLAASLLSLFVLALLAGTAVSAYFAREAGTRATAAEAAEKTAETKSKDAIAARNDAQASARKMRWRAYVSDMARVQTAWELGRIDEVRALLDAQRPANPDDDDLRGPEWNIYDRQLRAHVGEVNGIAGIAYDLSISPDGKVLATGSTATGRFTDFQGIQLWDAVTLAPLGTLDGVFFASFSPDSRRLATLIDRGSQPPQVRVFDVEKRTVVYTLDHPMTEVTCAVFSLDGKLLATASGDSMVRLWDMATGQAAGSLAAETAAGRCLAFRPGTQELACIGDDGVVVVWDVAKRARVHRWQAQGYVHHHAHLWSLAYSPNGAELAVGGEDGIVRLFDAATSRETKAFRFHNGPVCNVHWDPLGEQLVSTSVDQTVRVWGPAIARPYAVAIRGHSAPVKSAVSYPDLLHVATFAEDGSLKKWDTSIIREPSQLIRDAFYMFVAPSPDGQWMAAGSSGEGLLPLQIRDLATGLEAPLLPGPLVLTQEGDAAWSADSRSLAVASPQGLAVWDFDAGQAALRFSQKFSVSPAPTRVAFSPGGKHLALSLGERNVQILSAADGKQQRVLSGPDYINTIAYHPRLPLLATGSSPDEFISYTGGYSAKQPGSVTLWDETGQPVRKLEGHEGMVLDVAFDTQGGRLASASADRTIRIWETATGKLLRELRGHTGHVFGVAFSPDGKRLASSGHRYADFQGEIVLWDTETGERLYTDEGWGPVFAPKGELLFSAGAGVRVWDLAPYSPERKFERQAKGALRYNLETTWLPARFPVALAADPGLTPAVRQRALELVQRYRPDPVRLREASRQASQSQDAPPERRQIALEQAMLANQLAPGSPETLRALGFAQYRLEQFAAAIESLNAALKAAGATPETILPLLAMAQFRAKSPDYEGTRRQLDALQTRPEMLKQREVRQLLHQAEDLASQTHWSAKPLVNWQVVGPFAAGAEEAGLGQAFPPEERVDLKAEYAGKTGPVRWSATTANDKQFVSLPAEGQVVSYAFVEIESPRDQQGLVLLGSDDGAKVWVNGKLAYTIAVQRAAFAESDVFPVTLSAGRNAVLLKVSNGVGGSGFYFTLETPEPITIADGQPQAGRLP